jgi:hypothetical protein
MKIRLSILMVFSILAVLIIFLSDLRVDSFLPKIYTKRHAFIDLGANTGDSIRYFIDKNHNPSNRSREYLKGYGAKNNTKWDVYAVEANPYFNESLEVLKSYTESLGHTFFMYSQSAAWIKNEKLTFYLDTVNKGNY